MVKRSLPKNKADPITMLPSGVECLFLCNTVILYNQQFTGHLLGLRSGCEQGRGSEGRHSWVQTFSHGISLSSGFLVCKVALLWFLSGLRDKNALKHLAQLPA